MSKSIRTKLLQVVFITLLFMALLMGTSGIMIVNRLTTINSERIMTGIYNEQTYRLNSKLDIVKHSTNLIYEYVKQITVGRLIVDYEFLTENEVGIEEVAISVANQTDGAMAVYFRYNPELAGNGTSGFFWSRKSDNEKFVREEPTDILNYNKNDIEHVGWFYAPQKTGEAMWMTPYYNQNLDVFMISYVIPVYAKTGKFIGVIGMDIDFNSIIDAAGEEEFYEAETLAMVDLSEHLMYFSGDDGTVNQMVLTNNLYNHITTINTKSNLLKISDETGETSMICVSRMSNGMMLYVNVPTKEIYKERNLLVVIYVTVTVVIFAIAMWIVSKSAKSIIRPLRKLSDVAGRYADGDWSEQYVDDSSTEIKRLSESISVMAENTQKYIDRLNTLARKDSLTGIGNKTAYIELVEDIKRNRQGKYSKYELFVMDLNLLKKANDKYGHEAGDALLKEAGRYISRTFAHSAVFRIGGDEFVAIVTNEDYDDREKLTRKFEEGMGYIIPGDFSVELFISFGGAVYGEDGTDYEELFRIADDRMYKKKKEMKMERVDSI